MSRIDGVNGSFALSVQTAPSLAEAAEISLLPAPVGQTSGIAEQLARMIVQTGATKQNLERHTEQLEERATIAAEDREVAAMREKAAHMRTAVYVQGGMMMVSGALSVGGQVGDNKGAVKLGDAIGKTGETVKMIGDAVVSKDDAEIAGHRNVARRALRSADSSMKSAEEAGELISKALAFVREASRTEAETQQAAIRRA